MCCRACAGRQLGEHTQGARGKGLSHSTSFWMRVVNHSGACVFQLDSCCAVMWRRSNMLWILVLVSPGAGLMLHSSQCCALCRPTPKTLCGDHSSWCPPARMPSSSSTRRQGNDPSFWPSPFSPPFCLLACWPALGTKDHWCTSVALLSKRGSAQSRATLFLHCARRACATACAPVPGGRYLMRALARCILKHYRTISPPILSTGMQMITGKL